MRFAENFWRGLAGINGFFAVTMGAAAAHGVADPHLAALAEKASFYQLVHAVVLLLLADRPGRVAAAARWLFLAAILLFCGSLYVKALSGWPDAALLAPAGGLCFMAGWLCLGFPSRKAA